MKIGELAEQTGIAASTIRYYEREGLLPKARRGANGYRVYDSCAPERLELIQLGQSLGFSLDTIRALAALQGDALKDGMLATLEARLQEVDRLSDILEAQRLSLLQTKGQLQSAWPQGESLRHRILPRHRDRAAGAPEADASGAAAPAPA
jgi:DNA-binding transcriptional MerR regulator